MRRPPIADAAPLYRQVSEVIRSRIASGQYPVGDTLPTELNLQRSFGVSRDTVRRGLRVLINEGLLSPTPGVGTVVIRLRPTVATSHLRGLSEDLRRQGISTRAELLAAAIDTPSPFVRERLELAKGDRVLRLKRLRSIAGSPFALLHSFVPEHVGLRPDEDFSVPLYRLIERSRNLHIVYGRDIVGARAARAEEAELLGTEAGIPILTIKRTAFVEHERPVEYVEASIRSDLYEYIVTLPRGKDLS